MVPGAAQGAPAGARKQKIIDYLMKNVNQDDLFSAALFMLCKRGLPDAAAEETAAFGSQSEFPATDSPCEAGVQKPKATGKPPLTPIRNKPLLQSALPVGMQDKGVMSGGSMSAPVIAENNAFKNSFFSKGQGPNRHHYNDVISAQQSQTPAGLQTPAGFTLAELIEPPPTANTSQVPAGFALTALVPLQVPATAAIPVQVQPAAQMFDASFACGVPDGIPMYASQMCAQPVSMNWNRASGQYFIMP